MLKYLKALILFLLPVPASRLLFKLFGVKNITVGRGCRIGFSWITADRLILADGSQIGHLNYIDNVLTELGGGVKSDISIS